jgi:hypothetical protein
MGEVRSAQKLGGLILDVKCDKVVYGKNEPIELDIKLRNAGQRPQIVARRFSIGMRIRLDILAPDGHSAKRCGGIADEIVILKDNYKVLSQGDSVRGRLTISCDKTNDPSRAGYAFEHSGNYVIKAAYQLPMPRENYEKAFPSIHVKRGPVWAKPVIIEIR